MAPKIVEARKPGEHGLSLVYTGPLVMGVLVLRQISGIYWK